MAKKRKKHVLELRPEYVRRIKRIMKQKPIVYGTVEEMMRRHSEA